MGGRVPAEYYRKWRAAHPEYKKREAERSRRRKAQYGRGDRTKEYQRQKERRRQQRLRKNAELGSLAESSLVRKARVLAASMLKPDRRTTLHDDRHEDLVGEAVLALCEGKDPAEAMRSWLKKERSHRFFKWGSLDDLHQEVRCPVSLPEMHGEGLLRDAQTPARKAQAVPKLSVTAGCSPPPHDLVHAREEKEPYRLRRVALWSVLPLHFEVHAVCDGGRASVVHAVHEEGVELTGSDLP